MIGRAATLALLGSGAGADAAEVALCSLVTKPANFYRQAVAFQGTATAVKKTTSRRGNDYTPFKLQGPRREESMSNFAHRLRASLVSDSIRAQKTADDWGKSRLVAQGKVD